MKVRNWMSQPVIAAASHDPARKALAVMRAAGIHHMPVVDAMGELIGIVSSSDLEVPRWLEARDGLSSVEEVPADLSVADVMSGVVLTVGPDEPVDVAGTLIVEAHLHAVPVVDAGGFVQGILTLSDVVRALVAHQREARRLGLAPV